MRILNKAPVGLWIGDVKCRQIGDSKMKGALDMIYPLYLESEKIEEDIPDTPELRMSLQQGVLRGLINKEVIEIIPEGVDLVEGKLVRSSIPGVPAVSVDLGKVNNLEDKLNQLTSVVATLANIVAQQQQPKKSYYKRKKSKNVSTRKCKEVT